MGLDLPQTWYTLLHIPYIWTVKPTVGPYQKVKPSYSQLFSCSMLSPWCASGGEKNPSQHQSLPLSICLRKPLQLETLILPHLHERVQHHNRHHHDRLGAKRQAPNWTFFWCECQVECRHFLEWLHKHWKLAWGLNLRFSGFLRSVSLWHCKSFQPNPPPNFYLGKGFSVGVSSC